MSKVVCSWVLSLWFALLQSTCQCVVHAWQHSSKPPSSRRQILQTTAKSVLGVATIASAKSSPSQAACMPGDTSKECIGVYKVPVEDAQKLNDFLKKNPSAAPPNFNTNTNNALRSPRSVDEALQVLETQRLAADDILSVISQGKLEEGGVKVLNLIPRVSTAGQMVIRKALDSDTSSSSAQDEKTEKMAAIQQLKETQLESALNCVVAGFGECDILIGQGECSTSSIPERKCHVT